jgi:hypothetical protein
VEVGRVIDRILKMMAKYLISLAELAQYRRTDSGRTAKMLRFRDTVTGVHWAIRQRSPVTTLVGSQSGSKRADLMQPMHCRRPIRIRQRNDASLRRPSQFHAEQSASGGHEKQR